MYGFSAFAPRNAVLSVKFCFFAVFFSLLKHESIIPRAEASDL